MTEYANEKPNQNNYENTAADYLKKASEACASGDMLLGMHLYLAAFEQATNDPSTPTSVEVAALREAWELACDLKERSLAEYVFEKLEPFLTGEEIAECAMSLQELALDRLEQYGFSREELEDMAESITQDFLGDSAHVVKVESFSVPHADVITVANAAPADDSVEDSEGDADDSLRDESQDAAPMAPEEALKEALEGVLSGNLEITPEMIEAVSHDSAFDKTIPAEIIDELKERAEARSNKRARAAQVGMNTAGTDDFNPYDLYYPNSVGTSYHAATNEGSGAHVFTRDEDRAHALERAEAQTEAQAEIQAKAPAEQNAQGEQGEQDAQAQNLQTEHAQATPQENADNAPKFGLVPAAASAMAKGSARQQAQVPDTSSNVFNYRALAGYDETIAIMRDLGVGMQGDEGFKEFVRTLNSHHGIDRMPTIDTLLFRSPVIEDAARFVEATIGELGLPVLRMSMEEGVGGVPVLCVTTNGNNRPRMNHAHNRFEGPGILVIEDLDTWSLPEIPEGVEGFGNFIMANISRGAREAVSLIRSAVEDPDVYVMVTSSVSGEADPFFYELLEPMSIIDIAVPTAAERADIWAEIARDHPSIRDIDRESLVRFSEGLARYDIYIAAREAIEDAYKLGLIHRTYLPVSPQNMFDKLAACQPLDSEQYQMLEQAVLEDFRSDLDHLEDLIAGFEDTSDTAE